MKIVDQAQDVSKAFKIAAGKQITLHATGLQATDTVVVEVLQITEAGPAGSYCCPGVVTLPEAVAGVALKQQCDGKAVELTATQPWFVLDTPQEIYMQARVITADPLTAAIEVHLHETNSRILGC